MVQNGDKESLYKRALFLYTDLGRPVSEVATSRGPEVVGLLASPYDTKSTTGDTIPYEVHSATCFPLSIPRLQLCVR